MMHEPLISVVTPVYNGASFLKETVDSLLAQNYPNLEIIMIDDESPDNSVEVLKQFGDKVRIISQKNTGHVIARNVGLKEAKGEIIAFVDQDDIWTPGRMPLMLSYLTSGEYDFVRGKTLLFGENILEDKPIFRYPILGACMYHRSVLEKVGLFDETLDAGEDFDWHVRVEEAGCREKRIDATTLLYRQHTTNLSHTTDFLKRGQFDTLRRKLKREKDSKL